MTPERWEMVGQVFHEAVAKPAGEARAWVESVCAGDTEVAAEVLSLLGSDADAGKGFLTAQMEPAVTSLFGAPPTLPERVGPYRLVRELGRGGMGTVYLAERDDEQYQTQVAIKLVRRGMDTDLILHRFYRERQTLAQLQHPHIARLFDGGTTPDSLPYIVMEYVDGARITEHYREKRLTVPLQQLGRSLASRRVQVADAVKRGPAPRLAAQKLALFLDVCDAVDYAHRQFVVHRDLKPGNILVDTAGAAKLVDFGICKLLQTVGEETRDTSAGLMTPEYASPEQIGGEPITIASDVYSLAAVLYELLTGAKPHAIEDYTPLGIHRAICETEIVRPSLATGGKTARALEGDLDNILLFAMQKDPNRRDATIWQFADDIRRHLSYQPVKARPDTVTYRVKKFVRRRLGLVAAVAAVLVTMGAGVYFSVRSARLANRNLALVRQLSNTFVFDVYDSVRDIPGATNARKLIVETGLRYLDNLLGNAADDPTLRRELAAAYRRIGDVQGNVLGSHIGNTKEALASYQKSLALLTPLTVGPKPDREALLEQLVVLQRMASVYAYTKDLALTESSYQQASAYAEALFTRNPDDVAIGQEWANILARLSDVRRKAGAFQQAKVDSEKALELMRKFLAQRPDDEERQHSVAVAYAAAGLCEVKMGGLKPNATRFSSGLSSGRDRGGQIGRLVSFWPVTISLDISGTVVYSLVDGSVHAQTTVPSLAGGSSPNGLSGALDLFRQAAPEEFFRQLEEELGVSSRRRIFNLPLVIWLMMVQYLDRKATLSTAVQQVVQMRPGALLSDHKRLREGTVSAHTGAYSDARQRMPVEAAEKVADRVFAHLLPRREALPGWDRQVFILDGSTLELSHTPELVACYPPATNQHGISHWPVLQMLVAQELTSGIAGRPCWGPM